MPKNSENKPAFGKYMVELKQQELDRLGIRLFINITDNQQSMVTLEKAIDHLLSGHVVLIEVPNIDDIRVREVVRRILLTYSGSIRFSTDSMNNQMTAQLVNHE